MQSIVQGLAITRSLVVCVACRLKCSERGRDPIRPHASLSRVYARRQQRVAHASRIKVDARPEPKMKEQTAATTPIDLRGMCPQAAVSAAPPACTSWQRRSRNVCKTNRTATQSSQSLRVAVGAAGASAIWRGCTWNAKDVQPRRSPAARPLMRPVMLPLQQRPAPCDAQHICLTRANPG